MVDCSAPVFVARQIGLADIAARICRPLGLTRIRIDAESATTRDKINVEPGDSAWDVLQHAAEANGLWPWFTPDGTLVIGRPTTPAAPVATLKLSRAGRDNNVVRLTETRDVARRYSQLTVLGQTHGTGSQTGQHALRGEARDTGIGWYRPKVIVDHECDSTSIAQHRARKLLADARLDGYTLTAELHGHLVDAAARTPVPWAPGQRVHVVSEPHGIDEVMFVMGRRFEGGRDRAPTTILTLKQDGVWQLDAHPNHRQHRRGKNKTPGQIIDLS